MTLENYKKAMAEAGVNRGGFEDGAEIQFEPGGSQIGPTKQAGLLNPGSSTRAPKPPMEELPAHLIHGNALQKTAGKWWARLTPEERKKAQAQRAANAKAQGKKAVRIL